MMSTATKHSKKLLDFVKHVALVQERHLNCSAESSRLSHGMSLLKSRSQEDTSFLALALALAFIEDWKVNVSLEEQGDLTNYVQDN